LRLPWNDPKARALWDDYMAVYEDMFNHTSTTWAPWHVIPANHKWFTRLVVASIIYTQSKELNLSYPQVSKAKHRELLQAKKMLESER
jgi:polyphosphate kinase 2 (PPK2 family)